MQLLLRCPSCRAYTLEPYCKQCQLRTVNPDPSRFSIQDRYGNYRRKMKKLNREGKEDSQAKTTARGSTV